MLSTGDKVIIETSNEHLRSYVRIYIPEFSHWRGYILEPDEKNFPDCILLEPEELRSNSNFYPKIRIIKKSNITNIHKVVDNELEKLDIVDDKEIKTKVRTFKVESSDKTKKYDVTYNTRNQTYSCNCYAGMMNRLCKHVKAVKLKIE